RSPASSAPTPTSRSRCTPATTSNPCSPSEPISPRNAPRLAQMQAAGMAGGEGSRLRPLTINRPKPMVSIVNKPCLGHIFDLLKTHGITNAFVTLQYLASQIQDSFGDGGSVGMRLRYSVEESPLGTGGSVRQI